MAKTATPRDNTRSEIIVHDCPDFDEPIASIQDMQNGPKPDSKLVPGSGTTLKTADVDSLKPS